MSKEENAPLVSVIVPVYKAENYLHKCVDSLLAQTFTDFEIILVNDGSPDRSGEICDEYAKKDSRIKVIHKENGGVSSARQCGIDNAQGEYTIHADPDDWVENNMLEELYRKAKEEDADMVICDYYVEYKNLTKYIKQQPSALDHKTVLRELFQQLHGSCCNKFVRRTCYKRYDIHFPCDLKMYEDLFVIVSMVCHDLKISYLNRAFYHYDQVVNPQSITNKTTHNYTQYFLLDKLLKSQLSPIDYQSIQLDLLVKKAWQEFMHSVDFKNLHSILKEMKNQFPPHMPLGRKMFLKLAYLSPRFSRTLYHIIEKYRNKYFLKK